MKNNKFFCLILVTIFLFLITNKVDAASYTSSKRICINDYVYQVGWNKSETVPNEQTIINNKNIILGLNLNSNNKIGTTKLGNTTIEVQFVGQKCTCNNGGDCVQESYTTCESIAQQYTDVMNYLNVEFNSPTRKYEIYLKNYSKASDIKIRAFVGDSLDNKSQLSLSQLSGGTIKSGTEKYYFEPKNEKYTFEFYVSGGTCDGVYIGAQDTGTSSNPELANPALTDSSYGCNNLHSLEGISDSMKRSIVPYCYSETIFYSNLSSLRTEINRQYQSLQTILSMNRDLYTGAISNVTATSTDNHFTCDYNASNNIGTTVDDISNLEPFTLYDGEYWQAICFEYVKTAYDTPKYTTAGAGFGYAVSYTLGRVCLPIQKKQAEKPAICEYKALCTDGAMGDQIWTGMGPNEDFDNCIYSCDGGKYTQNCINKCYDNVYSNADNNNLVQRTNTSFSYNNSKNLTFLAYTNGQRVDSIPSGWVATDHVYSGMQNCVNGNCMCPVTGATWTVSKHCAQAAEHGVYGVATVYLTNGPRGSNCGDNQAEVNEIYERRRQASISEYNNVVSLMSSYTNRETLKYQITDSYLTTGLGANYVYEVGNKTDPQIYVEYPLKATTGLPYKVDYVNYNRVAIGVDDSASFQTVEARLTDYVKVALPESYINSRFRQVIYATNSSANGYEVYAAANQLKNIGRFDLNYYQTNQYNNRLYYTSLYSQPINPKSLWGTGFSPTYNIKFIATGLGTNQQISFDIKCFYGLDNLYYNEDNNDGSSDGGGGSSVGSSSSGGGGSNLKKGLQYIFRPVELTDLFPERNPRDNWRYVGDTNLYHVDAPQLINNIENLGANTYSDSELDYEVKLTRANLNSIRRYNKEVTYGDYTSGEGMVCSNSVCRSTFIENSSYVSNAGSVRKNANVGTNND